MIEPKSKYIDWSVLNRFLDAYALELRTEDEKEIVENIKHAADNFVVNDEEINNE